MTAFPFHGELYTKHAKKKDEAIQRDVAAFQKVVLPMIRRVIPGTIATELVGVEPMRPSSGKRKHKKKKHGK